MANIRKDVQAMVAVHAPISNLCEQPPGTQCSGNGVIGPASPQPAVQRREGHGPAQLARDGPGDLSAPGQAGLGR